jgi:hypothetical protein
MTNLLVRLVSAEKRKPAAARAVAGPAKTPDPVLAFSDRSETCLRPSHCPEACANSLVAKRLNLALIPRFETNAEKE